jgi:hypothetical protein
VPPSAAVDPLIMVVAAVLLLIAVAAFAVRELRLVLAVGLSSAVLLMLTPSWFPHYASLVAGPAAVAVAAGLDWWVRRLSRIRPQAGRAGTAATLALVAAYSLPMTQAHVGRAFPGAELGAVAERIPGCVTADDPTTLILMGVLGRNLEHRCPLVVDLGGWTYDHPPVPAVARARDTAFQVYARNYLSSGGAAISTRFSAGSGFSLALAQEVHRWPALAQADGFTLRRPELSR